MRLRILDPCQIGTRSLARQDLGFTNGSTQDGEATLAAPEASDSGEEQVGGAEGSGTSRLSSQERLLITRDALCGMVSHPSVPRSDAHQLSMVVRKDKLITSCMTWQISRMYSPQ